MILIDLFLKHYKPGDKNHGNTSVLSQTTHCSSSKFLYLPLCIHPSNGFNYVVKAGAGSPNGTYNLHAMIPQGFMQITLPGLLKEKK